MLGFKVYWIWSLVELKVLRPRLLGSRAVGFGVPGLRAQGYGAQGWVFVHSGV